MGTSSELVCLHIGLTGIGSTISALGTSLADIPLTYLSTRESHMQAWIIPSLPLKTHHRLLKLRACMAPMTTPLIIGWQHSYATSSLFQLHVIRGEKNQEYHRAGSCLFPCTALHALLLPHLTCSVVFAHRTDIFLIEEKAVFWNPTNGRKQSI